MTYARKIVVKNTIKLYIVPVLALLFLGVDLGYIHDLPLNKFIIGVDGTILFFLGYVSYPLFKKLANQYDVIENKIFDEINRAKQGERGEKEVFTATQFALTGGYTLHKNFHIPGKRFDIDAVIVGPKGIIIFEIKNYTNQLLFVGNEIFVAHGSKLSRVSVDRDPRIEAVWYSKLLQRYLREKGFYGLRVTRAVVFLKKYAALIKKGTKVGVFLVSGIDELDKYLNGLPADPRFTPAFCARINSLLK